MVKRIIKKIIKKIDECSLIIWRLKGSPIPPPPLYKQRVIREYAKKYSLSCFLETGTFLGDTLYSLISDFEYLASVELGDDLYENAVMRFRGIDKVHLYKGNSGVMMANMIDNIPKETFNKGLLFWLDAHYSAGITARGEVDTPIIQELDVILDRVKDNCAILIDDARLFVGENDYPTLEELKDYMEKKNKNYTWRVEGDSIRIVI